MESRGSEVREGKAVKRDTSKGSSKKGKGISSVKGSGNAKAVESENRDSSPSAQNDIFHLNCLIDGGKATNQVRVRSSEVRGKGKAVAVAGGRKWKGSEQRSESRR